MAAQMPPASAARPRRRRLSVADYVQGVLGGDRTTLGRTITLIESARPDHQQLARKIVDEVLPHTGKAIRLGITGVPEPRHAQPGSE